MLDLQNFLQNLRGSLQGNANPFWNNVLQGAFARGPGTSLVNPFSGGIQNSLYNAGRNAAQLQDAFSNAAVFGGPVRAPAPTVPTRDTWGGARSYGYGKSFGLPRGPQSMGPSPISRDLFLDELTKGRIGR